jgi:hypothetical protein
MNQPRTNPDTKSKEYHLRDTDPMLNISGFICQFTTNVSNMLNNFRSAKITIRRALLIKTTKKEADDHPPASL